MLPNASVEIMETSNCVHCMLNNRVFNEKRVKDEKVTCDSRRLYIGH